MDALIQLAISFMGGGVIAGLISWARIARSEREARKSEHLKDQMNNLYGPLYYFVSQNKQLFELNGKLMGAYDSEYVGKKWSSDPVTQNNIKEGSMQTIDIANTYVKIVTENNKKVVELLRNHAEFIDPEDNEVFQRFVIDNIRLEIERDEGGKIITPFMIYQQVGGISFMREEFKDLVIKKFIEKSHEIKKYH